MKRLAQFGLLVSLPLVLACAKGNKGADKAQAVADSARVDTTTMADRRRGLLKCAGKMGNRNSSELCKSTCT